MLAGNDEVRMIGRAALQYIMKTIAAPVQKKRSKTIEVNYDSFELDADGNHPILIKQNIAKIVAKQPQPSSELPFFQTSKIS